MLEPAVIVLIMLNLETLNSSNYKIKNCIIIQSRVCVCERKIYSALDRNREDKENLIIIC